MSSGEMVICCTGVPTGTRGVKTCCGAYDSTVDPGCAWYLCCCQSLDTVSLKVNTLDVKTSTKTSDDVTIDVSTTILYKIDPERVYHAYYRSNNIKKQMAAFVEDEVRSEVPRKTLDDVYLCKGTLSTQVQTSLQGAMGDFGIIVEKVCLTELQPDRKVLGAMQEINCQQRQRLALSERAEARKIEIVKHSEADCIGKEKEGRGVAMMRSAIVDGCKDSVQDFSGGVGVSAHNVVDMMMAVQYFDTLDDFSKQCKFTVLTE